ncbi:MAG TPA: translation initiation factor IF-2, partial [Phycisphaerae bacterium]|nr:translation initiation factor IF-2 [Phycisphaerae bacterium]
REWGGQTEVIHTSAETGEGIDDLVELLSLEAEILELHAETDAPASGYIVEARMDPGRGVVATLLVLNGTLKSGDVLLAGRGFGRVRQIYDDKGKSLKQAPPSTPAVVTGLDEVPDAGDRFFVVEDIEQARTVAEQRRSSDRVKILASAASAPKNLEELIGKIEDGEVSEIPVIVKADVQGSIEAIVGVLEKLGSEETRVNILHTAVGGISTGDVTLAEASGAIIIGFNIVADAKSRKLAESQKIDIRLYRVIYDIAEDMRGALEEGLVPEIREESLGRSEVRQTFKVSRIGTIAGIYVTEGVVQRNALVRIIRDNVVIEDERTLDSLRRVKDDAREVRAGLECGVKITGYNDIKEGDVLEFYQKIEIARTL